VPNTLFNRWAGGSTGVEVIDWIVLFAPIAKQQRQPKESAFSRWDRGVEVRVIWEAEEDDENENRTEEKTGRRKK